STTTRSQTAGAPRRSCGSRASGRTSAGRQRSHSLGRLLVHAHALGCRRSRELRVKAGGHPDADLAATTCLRGQRGRPFIGEAPSFLGRPFILSGGAEGGTPCGIAAGIAGGSAGGTTRVEKGVLRA